MEDIIKKIDLLDNKQIQKNTFNKLVFNYVVPENLLDAVNEALKNTVKKLNISYFRRRM